MCGPATALGVASGISSGISAIGSYQQGKAQTEATNRARLNQYNDALRMNEFQFQSDERIRRAAINDYKSGLREADIALSNVGTGLGKAEQDRLSASRFAGLDRASKLMQDQGKLMVSMQAGRSRDRALAMQAGAAGRDEALDYDNLLRARFADMDKYRSAVDQATSYRRQLYSQVPLATLRAPTPSAPVMASGPSALSLIGGLGQAAIGGISLGTQAKKGNWFKQG